jgi:hypothetical protein
MSSVELLRQRSEQIGDEGRGKGDPQGAALEPFHVVDGAAAGLELAHRPARMVDARGTQPRASPCQSSSQCSRLFYIISSFT